MRDEREEKREERDRARSKEKGLFFLREFLRRTFLAYVSRNSSGLFAGHLESRKRAARTKKMERRRCPPSPSLSFLLLYFCQKLTRCRARSMRPTRAGAAELPVSVISTVGSPSIVGDRASLALGALKGSRTRTLIAVHLEHVVTHYLACNFFLLPRRNYILRQ